MDHDRHVENEEGLPLLWNTTLDQAPKKTEETIQPTFFVVHMLLLFLPIKNRIYTQIVMNRSTCHEITHQLRKPWGFLTFVAQESHLYCIQFG